MTTLDAVQFESFITAGIDMIACRFCNADGDTDPGSLPFVRHLVSRVGNYSAATCYVAIYNEDQDPDDGDLPQYIVSVYDFVKVLANGLGLLGGGDGNRPCQVSQPENSSAMGQSVLPCLSGSRMGQMAMVMLLGNLLGGSSRNEEKPKDEKPKAKAKATVKKK